MKDGIYHVAFNNNKGAVGEGIIVVCCGVINGGDVGFVYQGKLERPEMSLKVTRYHDDIPSVLGMESNYELVMQYLDEIDEQYMLGVTPKNILNSRSDVSVRPLQGEFVVAQKRQEFATTSNVSHSQTRLRDVMKMRK